MSNHEAHEGHEVKVCFCFSIHFMHYACLVVKNQNLRNDFYRYIKLDKNTRCFDIANSREFINGHGQIFWEE